MSEGEFRTWLKAFVEDLRGRPDSQIEYACRRYRQDPKSRFLPTPGQIITLCTSPYADKPARSNGRMVDGVFQPWGGACQCQRCVNKTPSEGFFRASGWEYDQAAKIRAELDYDMERRLGYDPKIGNPNLDNTIERQRSPAELKALLARTRKANPQAFGTRERPQRQPIPHEPSNPDTLAEVRAKLAGKVEARESGE